MEASSTCAIESSKIQVGMTLAQVEELLGGPPGNYSTKHAEYPWSEAQEFSFLQNSSDRYDRTPTLPTGAYVYCWHDDETVLFLAFDQNKKVNSQPFRKRLSAVVVRSGVGVFWRKLKEWVGAE